MDGLKVLGGNRFEFRPSHPKKKRKRKESCVCCFTWIWSSRLRSSLRSLVLRVLPSRFWLEPGALVFLVAAPAVLARQLRFHRRAHAALLDRTL